MNLSIVIPVHNEESITRECIDNIYSLADGRINLVIIDNASVPAYKQRYNEVILRNEENRGVFHSIIQGVNAASNNVVLTMHNDVIIHERSFDTRILGEFEKDNLLGIAGFFGGRGVSMDGGRGMPESNMLGLKYGTHGGYHGQILIGTHPAVVFDSLALIMRKDYLTNVNIKGMPPHHFFDRILTLAFIEQGYHALTIGIAHDHAGGTTSTKVGSTDFIKRWCQEQGLEIVENPDYTMYKYGEALFQKRWKDIWDKGALWVDENFNYVIRTWP